MYYSYYKSIIHKLSNMPNVIQGSMGNIEQSPNFIQFKLNCKKSQICSIVKHRGIR